MKLFMIHAPERCKPCLEMGNRIASIKKRRPNLFQNDPVVLVHADHEREKAEAVTDYKILPTLVLKDDDGAELFKAEGRISELLATKLIEACAFGEYEAEEFRDAAPSANVVFYRTYARRTESDQRETYAEAIDRVVNDIVSLGQLNQLEAKTVRYMAEKQHCLPSGRWLWVGGTAWIKRPENFSGAYNCTSTDIIDPASFGLLMELAMMGSGTGANLEKRMIEQLPAVMTKINVLSVSPVGEVGGNPDTVIEPDAAENTIRIIVGDSRMGWVSAYQQMIDLAFTDGDPVNVHVDLSQVRPAGEKLKGFGGQANPVKLGDMFHKVGGILKGAYGRQLTAVECSLLIDEAAACVVAGNIRRSAGMRQFSWDDLEAANAKDNLYTQGDDGSWRVDVKKEALRMANHTRCAHKKPTLEEVTEAVRKQFHSGEGAIQYVPEAIARSSADLFPTLEERQSFVELYEEGLGRDMICAALDVNDPDQDKDEKEFEIEHRMRRYGLNPCGEILGSDFHCNLAEVHLNTIDPKDVNIQNEAFKAAALQVSALLHHDFVHDRYRISRELDPIVGVSFTGLFDFFVHAFGSDWLGWMMDGRPDNEAGRSFVEAERGYLSRWREVVKSTVEDYCKRHKLRAPNRTTTVQPAGTKSLLTGASSGWHPPKAQRFIRRVTVGQYDPVAMAAIEYGYSVIPAQSARDDSGALLDDIHDPRSREWLIEIPTEVSWANLPGADQYDLSKLSAKAQFGLYMQVQNYYTEHNTSATVEFRENEIDELSQLIHDSMGKGYISAALLARFDSNATFPRLPFEPIDAATYQELAERVSIRGEDCISFHHSLAKHDRPEVQLQGAAGCDSDKCLVEASAKDADQVGASI